MNVLFLIMAVDVIMDILKVLLAENPGSVFVNSLHQQYCNRGGLSKKQLEGLHAKAQKIEGLPVAKLATLEAIIRKKPTRYKSEKAQFIAPPKDLQTMESINAILEKFPHHKRILFLKSKHEHNDPLSAVEIDDIEKLRKLLLK